MRYCGDALMKVVLRQLVHVTASDILTRCHDFFYSSDDGRKDMMVLFEGSQVIFSTSYRAHVTTLQFYWSFSLNSTQPCPGGLEKNI